MPLLELTRELVEAIARQYPTLETLTLARNALSELPFLELLPPLRRLDLSDNRLRKLPPEIAAWGASLQFLDLGRNALESLQRLAACEQLRILKLDGNSVALFSELKYLQPLAQLRELTLDGNPIASFSTYRREVLTMLPQLEVLDGHAITQAERLYASLQQKPMVATVLAVKEEAGGGGGGEDGDDEDVHTQAPMAPPSLDLSNVSHAWTSAPLAALSSAASPLSVAPSSSSSSSSRHQLLTPAAMRPPPPPTRRHFLQSDAPPAVPSSIPRPQLRTADGEPVHLLQSRVAALEKILSLQDGMLQDGLIALGRQRGQPVDVERAAQLYVSLLATWRRKVVSLMVQVQASELAVGLRPQRTAGEGTEDNAVGELRAQAELWRHKSADALAQRDLERVRADAAQRQCEAVESKVVKVVRSLAAERERIRSMAEMVAAFTSRESVVTGELTVLAEGTRRLEAFETRLRLLAERVALASRLVAHREARLRNSEAAMEAEQRIWRHRVQGEGSGSAHSGPLVVLRRPKTQQAVRSVFHRLDPYHTGLVEIAPLLAALRGDSSVRETLGRKGSSPIDCLEDALRARRAEGTLSGTITWGELLLVLMPLEVVAEKEAPLRVDDLPPPFDAVSLKGEEGAEEGTVLTRQQLQALSKRELLSQVLLLQGERRQLQGRVAADARLLQRRAEWIESQWSGKVNTLAAASEELLRSLEAERRRGSDLESRLQEAQREAGEAQYQLQSLRRQLSEQASGFASQRRELEAQHVELLERERREWQGERVEAVAQVSALQAESTKLELTIRQLERELAKQRERRERSEAVQVAELEGKVRKRDDEIAKLRRERNAILNALREQEKKAAEASAKTMDSVATQTVLPVMKSTAVQTVRGGGDDERMAEGEGRSSSVRPADRKLRVEDMTVPASTAHHRLVAQHSDPAPPRVAASDLHQRLQHLESLTASLLAD